MKNKMIYVGLILVSVVAVLLSVCLFTNKCDTRSKREAYLDSVEKGTHIVAEQTLEETVVCQIQCNNRNGYAVFEKKGLGYKCTTRFLASQEIVVNGIYVKEQFFHVLICNIANPDRISIVYENPDTSEVIETKEIALNGSTMCIVKAIEAPSYSLSVTFFDRDGNAYK